MRISSLGVDSIKSTLRKRLGKKSKTNGASSNEEPANNSSYESRDDEAQVHAVTTRADVQDLRDDAQRDATVVPGRAEIEVEAPTNKDIPSKQTSGGVRRGKVKGLFSPAIRAISLRKKRVPEVSKVLKVNSQKQESPAFDELKEAPSAAAVDEVLQDIESPSCEDDNVSCASFEVKNDGVQCVQFTPGSEHVENEEGSNIPEEQTSEVAAEIKNTEADIEPSLSISSWSLASLLCMDTGDVVKNEVDEEAKDEHPTEKDESAVSTSTAEPLATVAPSSVLISNETETAELPSSEADSGNIIVADENSNEEPVMPSAPTLSNLPSKEVDENSSLKPNVLESKTEDVNETQNENGPAAEKASESGSENTKANKKTPTDKFNEKMKTIDAKKKKSVNARKTPRTVNVEHLFQPSEIPLERSVSDAEVILLSVKPVDGNVEEAYELVKPASWHGVEHQFADSEEEADDDSSSIMTHLSGVEEEFNELSNCGLSDGMHNTLIWCGEKLFNICPEPCDSAKKRMIDTARISEETAYVVRDVCHGKF